MRIMSSSSAKSDSCKAIPVKAPSLAALSPEDALWLRSGHSAPHLRQLDSIRSFVPAVSVVGTRSGRPSPCDLCPCPCEEGSKNHGLWPFRKAFFELPCTCSCVRPCRDRIAMCPPNSPQIGGTQQHQHHLLRPMVPDVLHPDTLCTLQSPGCKVWPVKSHDVYRHCIGVCLFCNILY